MPRTYRGVVFLADDDESVRLATEDLLEEEGYLVLSARTGSEALARMRGAFLPGIAIIDLIMPGMSGWDLIAAMKADSELSRIPIIVLTAQTRIPEAVQRVIKKPYDADELLIAVHELSR